LLVTGLSACPRAAEGPPPRPWKVTLLKLDDGAETQAVVDSFVDELRKSSAQPDMDYTVTVQSAHGSAVDLPGLAAAAVRDGAHTLVAIGTPALQAARAAAQTTPVVFTDVANPALAGVEPRGIWRRWLPFLFAPERPPVTGAYAAEDFTPLLDASSGMVNGRLGAVVVGADRDALGYRDALRQAADWSSRSVDFEMAGGAADVGPAAARLCGRGAVALVALGDRASTAAFEALMQGARACGIPVFGTLRAHAEGGATVTFARDANGAAREAGRMVARLARGERPDDIAVAALARTSLIVNAGAAEEANVGIPFALIQKADQVLGD